MGKYTSHHPVVFVLTFISYAFFHATRKTFSNVKSSVSDEWTPSFHNKTVQEIKPDSIWNKHHMFDSTDDVEPFLGILDASFMVAYAVGLFISGMIGDRFDMRKVLAFGMCSSAITVFFFGCVFEWTSFYNKYVYVIIWILNGLLQSTGWPNVVAVMGNWFGRSSRGFVLGLWSSCASVGNIIGALMVSSVLNYGYDYAFLLTSCTLFAGGLINFFGLVTTPRDLGLPVPDEPADMTITVTPDLNVNVEADEITVTDAAGEYESDEEDSHTAPLLGSSKQSASVERPKAVGFCMALFLPGVILYALAYACLKLVNYSFFFWLPFYLKGAFSWKETVADQISIWYDIGGIIGGTLAGIISDRFQRRTIVVMPMLILGIPALLWYSNSPNDLVINAALMTLSGFFIGGVSNLVSAAISADLGRQEGLHGSSEALATVTGIVDGTGSIGAAIGQILVPVIQQSFDWHAVFYLFMLMTFLTGVCIFPLFLREMRQVLSSGGCSWFKSIWTAKPAQTDPLSGENSGIPSNEHLE
ncbi:hypothetical protein ScPMuIL_009121 [Solemya velum]